MKYYTLKQLRGAWAAGFHAGQKGKPQHTGVLPIQRKESDALIGAWFHTFTTTEEGERIVNKQGKILSKKGEFYTVQLYSWLSGDPNGTEVYSLREMETWQFYQTNQQMLDWWDEHESWRWERR